MKVRLILGAAVVAVVALGVSSVGFSAGHRTPTIVGMVGGDFDVQLPAGGQVGADWGVDASFQRPATNRIHDRDVKVVGPGSGDREDGFRCRGSVSNPLAPKGKVCVYLIGSGNATNIRGVTPVPGTGGSRFGFKLIWDANGNNGDTFVDAVWAYHFS
jgi:hypothetical protein